MMDIAELIDQLRKKNTKLSIHWKERQAIIHALFDLSMKHDVIFSILDTPKVNLSKGLFSAFPIYDEIMKEGVPARA